MEQGKKLKRVSAMRGEFLQASVKRNLSFEDFPGEK